MNTLVHRYGLLPPTVNPDAVAAQIRLAHAYQNKLVELEQSRRSARDELLGRDPTIATLDSQRQACLAELETERAALSAIRSETRSKTAGDPTRAKTIRAQLKGLWAERKAALKEALTKAEIIAQLAEVSAKHKAGVKAARAACGVYWGTYLLIEQAAEQASKAPTPPRFQRWCGEGAVSVQLMAQKGQEHKQAVAGVISGENNYVRLNLTPAPVPNRGGKPLPRLLLRIGTQEDGRSPIFAEWPIILHRPLPEGSLVKWVKIVRRRIGSHDQWSAHFTLAVAPAPDATGSAIAVNLRWSKTVIEGEATTLAADWATNELSGDVNVPPTVVSQLRKSDDLRSIRDKNFNREKARLAAAIKGCSSAPDELKARLEHLHAWKSQGKLAAAVIWWRNNRFPGDEAAFAGAEAWRRQDKHLWDWEANARRKALAQRKDAYRVFAASMVRLHHTLVIEKLNIARLAKTPTPEEAEDRDVNAQSSSQRFATAPSELRSALINAFRRQGGAIVEVQAGLTAKEMLMAFQKTGGAVIQKAAGRSVRTTRLLKNKGLASTPVERPSA